jgi:cobalt-zinc-cadmium efflux system outer membrane protein
MRHVWSSHVDVSCERAGYRLTTFQCRRLLVAALVLLLTSVPVARGHAAEPLTLEHAIQIVREHNPELLAARQELDIARGRLVKAEYPSQFNPEVAGEGGHRQLGAGGSGADYGVALSQELEVAGQRGKRIEEARANLARVEQLVRDRTRLIEAEVQRTFFAALARRQRRDLLQHVEGLNRRVRDASQARVKAGESPVMEANLAEIRFGQSRKETLVAEKDYTATLLELKRLLNVTPDATLDPSGELRAAPATYDLRTLIARAAEARPDLLAGEREVKRVDAETALTRRLIIPNPTLEGFYREEAGIDGSERIVGGGLRIPLPVFDRRQGELMALAGRRRQAQFEVDGTLRTVEKEVADTFQSYEAARREVGIFEQDILRRAEENFRFIETAYRAGKIDFLQFVVVQNDLVSAQLSYLDSLAALREAEVNLERAVGAPLETGVSR